LTLPPFDAILHLSAQFMMIYDSEIVTAIYQGLETLGDTNEMIHAFWVNELYDENDEPIPHMWSGDTLKQIETDVMYQLSV
jgi:hypothetical protein